MPPHGLQPARLLCPWDSPGKNTGVGFYFLFQGIFPTQESNLSLLLCRQILYQLSHEGSTPSSSRGIFLGHCLHISQNDPGSLSPSGPWWNILIYTLILGFLPFPTSHPLSSPVFIGITLQIKYLNANPCLGSR